MYEHLLISKLPTAAVAVLLAAAASGLLGAPRLWWRAMLFNVGPMLAAAFYAEALVTGVPVDSLDLASGFFFEFVCLCLFFVLFITLYQTVQRISVSETRRFLKIILFFQIAFAIPNLLTGGFGIFSEGSRIEYLYEGSLPKYFTYAGIMATAVQGGILAARISQIGRIGKDGLLAVVVTLALSVLSGSKGAVFLWMLTIAALVDYNRAKMSKRTLAAIAIVACVALLGSSLVIAEFLGIELATFFDLALTRFFLNNDARALAFDLRSSGTAQFSLLSEAFRSVSALFGAPPQNAPLGLLLYENRFSLLDGSGANTSTMALITFYSLPGYAFLPAIIAATAATIFAYIFVPIARMMRSSARRMATLTLGLIAAGTLSQDFLAFQVVAPLTALAVLFMWILDSHIYRRNAKQRTPNGSAST